jgi:hypothetical protein
MATLPNPAQATLKATGVLDPGRIDRGLENLEQMVRDRQTRLFIGLAASIFAEIENAAIDVVSSSVIPDTAAAIRAKITLEGAHRYRLAVRPTIRLRPSREVTIRVYPYLKLPLEGPRRVTLPSGESRLDYRRDVLSEMTWSIRPEDSGLERVDFVFTLNHFFDNVPPALTPRIIADALAAGRVYDRVTAEEAHRFVSMSLRVQW